MSLPSLKDYSLIEKIGSGSYATVYKAFKKGGSREVIAIKCVDKKSLSKSAVDNIVTEINLLKVLNHDHIVEMKDFFWDEGHIYIVMEYCDGGDLSNFIKKRHKLSENICSRFLQQLALALRYLRSNNVSHMDLKPQNLLLKTKPALMLKVGDFGFAQHFSDTEQKCVIRGSPLYMAPEMLLRHKYDTRVDLWSVGVIMYECLFGKAPYSSSSFQELAEKIKACKPIEIPKGSHISNQCRDLLMSLLIHDPEKRISFEQFFAHEFLDLEHAPTKESYEKSMKLSQDAVKMDSEKNYKEAFYLYCEALRYIIPHLKNEVDIKRKSALRLHVNNYMQRAEKLKEMSYDTCEIEASKSNDKVDKIHVLKTAHHENTSFCSKELRGLSKSTPSIANALEIGEIGDQYFSEGNYALALEKLQSSLSIIVPLLSKEPPGRRRDLLYKQVQLWMKEAESIKGLLATINLQENNVQKTSDSIEQCLIQ
ncbi:serine/threonine-protein kinase ULK3 [Prorops nasuta]|uniref:serine/threonine-protein kinase ULK3 n=1 Tax=Prorops nasuta TaxID=863751 RepID=UPI0034CE1653